MPTVKKGVVRMAVDLVWRFSDRQRAQDFLWALLLVGKARGWWRLVVAVDWRERVEVGMCFDELIAEGKVEWIDRLLRESRLPGVTVDDLVDDPWQWHELYLNGGVKAFRWWQGAGPTDGGAGSDGLPRPWLLARRPAPGGDEERWRGASSLPLPGRELRTIYRTVNLDTPH